MPMDPTVANKRNLSITERIMESFHRMGRKVKVHRGKTKRVRLFQF